MEKLVRCPACKGGEDLADRVKPNRKAIAKRLDRDISEIVVVVLDRPRHHKLIDDIRKAGARIRLIGDGDLSAGIAAAVTGTGVHPVIATRGPPAAVITAPPLPSLNG